jgi:hypothetical protein
LAIRQSRHPIIESPAGAAYAIKSLAGNGDVTIAGVEVRPAAPTADRRGDGIVIQGPLTGKLLISDVWVRWFEQNITLLGSIGSDAQCPELVGVRSGYSWASAEDAAVEFKGQALYIEGSTVITIVRGCLLAHAGWPDGPADKRRNRYRHGDYSQYGNKQVRFIGCIVADNANAGLQIRDDGEVDECLFVRNGVSLLTISSRESGSRVDCRRCAFLGAHCYWEAPNWTGALAVSVYAPTWLGEVVILSVPNDSAMLPTYTSAVKDAVTGKTKQVTSRVFQLGAIAVSKKHSSDKAHGTGSIVFDKVTVAWTGPVLTGDKAAATSTVGLTVLPNVPSVSVDDLIAQAWTGGDVAGLARQGINRARAVMNLSSLN